jgi:hypothetical protein
MSRGLKKIRRCPTLPVTIVTSTIGAEGLNCRVRDGIGCDPLAIITGNCVSAATTDAWKTDELFESVFVPTDEMVVRRLAGRGLAKVFIVWSSSHHPLGECCDGGQAMLVDRNHQD